MAKSQQHDALEMSWSRLRRLSSRATKVSNCDVIRAMALTRQQSYACSLNDRMHLSLAE